MDDRSLEDCLNEFRTWYRSSERNPLLILSVCRRGRHRSVGFRELTSVMLANKYPDLDIRQGPQPLFPNYMCVSQEGGCVACAHQDPALIDSVKIAHEKFGDKCVRILGVDALNPAGSKRGRGSEQRGAEAASSAAASSSARARASFYVFGIV